MSEIGSLIVFLLALVLWLNSLVFLLLVLLVALLLFWDRLNLCQNLTIYLNEIKIISDDIIYY